MRSKWTVRASVLVTVLVLTALLFQGAGAGNFHFKSTSISLGSLIFSGDLVGLGNETAFVTLTAHGTVKALCQNKGGTQAPGRNAIEINVTETESYVTDENGLAPVEVAAEDPNSVSDLPSSPTSRQAGCPNGNWKIVGIVDGSTDWTAAQVVVKDDLGQVQIDLSFTCDTTIINGVATSIQCTET